MGLIIVTASIVGTTLSGKDHSKGESNKRGRGRRKFRGRGGINNFIKRSDLQCKHCGKTGNTSNQCWDSWDSIKDKHNQKKDDQDASKSSDSYIVAHCLSPTLEELGSCVRIIKPIVLPT